MIVAVLVISLTVSLIIIIPIIPLIALLNMSATSKRTAMSDPEKGTSSYSSFEVQ